MLEPVEAEFAQPPIYTDAQEEILRDEDAEEADAITIVLSRVSSPASRTNTYTNSPQSHSATTLAGEPPSNDFKEDVHKSAGDAEKLGNGRMTVHFDPGENPKEWTKARKWYATTAASLLCLVVALGSAMPTGDLPGAAETLHVSDEAIYLSITLFVAGFGIGPLIFAPLSEVVGRRPIYAVSMIFYFLFTLPSCLAKNIATMLAGRMIAGLASSAPFTNVGGTIADVWDTKDRGLPMAMFSSTLFMGPCLGPLFGGWIAERTHTWRWIYWVLFIFVGAAMVLCVFTPETLAPVLLRKKANKLNKKYQSQLYVSEHDLNRLPFSETLKNAMVRPIILMFCEPIIILFTFYLSFVYALLYATFFAFPIAFEEIRGWSMGMTGVTFVSIIIGIAIANCLMPIQERLYRQHSEKYGPAPEARLYPMMLGALVLPVALFILAFTSYPGIIWVGPCISGILFGFSMVIIYISGNSYVVDSYANVAASAISAKNMTRSLIGASVPLWITQLFHNLGFQYGGLLLALVSVVIIPIPYYFYYKGASVRKRSKRTVQ
ncbi:spermine transporter [Cryptococcus neoformans c45]|nr:spermine transporter [Cryptococcus neoformans var. grubii c45]